MNSAAVTLLIRPSHVNGLKEPLFQPHFSFSRTNRTTLHHNFNLFSVHITQKHMKSFYMNHNKDLSGCVRAKRRRNDVCLDNIYFYFPKSNISSGQMNVLEKLAEQFAEYYDLYSVTMNCTLSSWGF